MCAYTYVCASTHIHTYMKETNPFPALATDRLGLLYMAAHLLHTTIPRSTNTQP